MARKPNYDFEKRRKEIERKAKKDEKLRRKRESAEEGGEPAGGEGGADDSGIEGISPEDAAALGLRVPTSPPKE